MSCIIPLLLLTLGANSPPAERPAAEAALCEVALDGQGIKELVLQDDRGAQHKVDPAQPIRLPEGRYRVMKAVLQGGFTYSDTVTISNQDWFTVRPGEPYRLQCGGPLVPNVQVSRQGDSLWMAYRLVDVAGRPYSGRDRSSRPHFTVYQDGKQVGSGDFEYG